MIRARAMAVAAAVTGALLLSACGGGDGSKSSAAAAADAGKVQFKSGTAQKNHADMSKGDTASNAAPDAASKASKPVIRKWVQLTASSAGQLNPVVVNGAKFVLYRFDKDTASPSKSNCTDECAVTWPPLLVARSGIVNLVGVKKSAVGFIPRDGGFQVTLGGWPLYLFSKDTKPGDTNGQGVGGTWFGVTPDGQRAGQGDDTSTALPTLPPGADIVPAAKNATFFDVANFGEPAEGIGGPGCKPVRFNGSVQISGFAKVWSGDDCTGKSVTINQDVTDLNSLGIGRVNSIGFASSDSSGTPAPTGSSAKNATFFDVANFGEPAEGIGGPGCKPVRFNGSVQISGSAKVWSGDDCTGDSVTINQDVTDLNSLDIGPVNSIRFSG
jgi:predicted lipoprotein with Yx(FWY)xxD motif